MKKGKVFVFSFIILSVLIFSIASVSAFVWYDPSTWFDFGESCGNGDCGDGENCDNCEADCGICYISEFCGNGICDFNEDSVSCLGDCPIEYCGDGTCNNNEDCDICPSDCGVCDNPYCGDGICDPHPNTEGCDNCEADCGVCPIYGCMNPAANNYDPDATVATDCFFNPHSEIYGCTEHSANNYDSTATQDDGSCTYDSEIYGCMNSLATNYNPEATEDDGTCTFDYIYGCTNSLATNYNPEATQDDGSCTFTSEIYGCTNSSANNYNSAATIDDGTCTFETPGECQLSLFNTKIYLDEQYKQDTLEKRMFTPDKITPFDDIVCEVQFENTPPNSEVTCPTHTIKGELKTMSNPEASESEDTNWDISLKEGIFEDSNDEDGKYSWEITGWGDDEKHPVGWSSGDNLDKLIEAKKVKCFAYLQDKPDVKDSTSKLEQPYSNCVHLWGKEDAFSIDFMRGKSTELKSNALLYLSLNNIKKGMETTSPFKEYQDYFSYYADLKLHDDSDWSVDNFEGRAYFSDSVSNKISSVSECKGQQKYVLYNSKTYSAYVSSIGGDNIYLNPSFYEHSFIHEFGHAFGGLEDEYPRTSSIFDIFMNTKNCMTFPNWGNYGGRFSGCSISIFGKRPSVLSVMGNNDNLAQKQFNVVSCGYLLKKILKNSPPEVNELITQGYDYGSIDMAPYWQACTNPTWNTIKQTI